MKRVRYGDGENAVNGVLIGPCRECAGCGFFELRLDNGKKMMVERTDFSYLPDKPKKRYADWEYA